MIINYLKIIFRSILNKKFYTFVNITGLTLGIVTSLLIILFIVHEFSYDRFHKDAERIFRVALNGRIGEQEFNTCYSAPPVGSQFVAEIPEIESYCRIALWKNINLRSNDDTFTEKEFLLADSNFFKFFSFELIQGDPKTALKEVNSLILTVSSAEKIFGETFSRGTDLTGQLLTSSNGSTYTVTGIVLDPPHNSHFHFSSILSMISWDESRNPAWVSNNLITYVKLMEPSNRLSAEAKFPDMVKKYVGPQVQQVLGISLDQFFEQGGKYGYSLQPLLDIHLYSTLDGELEAGGNLETIYLLGIIVIALILIACVNFMNLSTARYMKRAKEVGIRKTLGSSRKAIAFQFLGESTFFSLCALFLSFIILSLTIPSFNNLSGKNIVIMDLLTPQYLGVMFLMALFIGLLAGSYPAFYLSSFRPLDVLSGKISSGSRSGSIRKGLVIFQFTLSLGLIFCTLLIYKQLLHLQQQDLGFDKENILVISNMDELGNKKSTFEIQLDNVSGVQGTSFSTMVPPDVVWTDIFQPVGQDEGDRGFSYFFADEDLVQTMNLEIIAGRFFSRDYPSDSSAVIINETAAKLLGWENPVGESIRTHWKVDGSDIRKVIGVIEDYNFQSLREEITSLVIFYGNQGNMMLVKLSSGDIQNQVELIQSEWEKLVPGVPFEYSFVDERFDAAFRQEQRLGKIFMLFSGLAIFVACLGLFGLATFTSEQRAKEIGIRKSMGSSSLGIVELLLIEYLKLIVIAFVLASPLAIYVMSQWLTRFAYKTNIGFMVFVMGGCFGLVIAILSVTYQSIKAANKNPVETLKYQ